MFKKIKRLKYCLVVQNLIVFAMFGFCAIAQAAVTTPIKPEFLKKGDTVALIAPGFEFNPDRLTFALQRMQALGLRPIYDNSILQQNGYFAGTAAARAKSINDAIHNPEVKAIVALRGGYGTADVLDKIDYSFLQKHPKIILGYSDITALLIAAYDKAKLVTFHGPLATSRWTAFTTQQAKSILFSQSENLTLSNLEKDNPDKDIISIDNPAFTITPGVVEGVILGGNLSVLSSLIGTAYFPDNWQGKILFLEDVGEDVYSIDRMLGQLKHIGVLSQISGFVFGTCSGCKSREHNSFYLNEVLDHYVKPLGIPAYRGAMIGHQDNIFTVPIGVRVRLDADKKTIQLLESATSSPFEKQSG